MFAVQAIALLSDRFNSYINMQSLDNLSPFGNSLS